MTAAAVAVRGLAHRFSRGNRVTAALDGVDVAVAPGELVSVVGPSGCGKSTLLKVLAGVLVPSAGTARIGGHDVVGRPGRAAYMPQRDLLLPWRRAMENATLGCELDGLPRGQARLLAAPLFERFGLAGFERAWPSELSGGMRQRLALLRTFLLPREAVLLDEPFGALDAITRRQMVDWLQDIWLDDRRASLFVTHDVEEALVLADRVVVLSARPGRVRTVVPVPFPRPRAPELVTDLGFVALRRTVMAALAPYATEEGSSEQGASEEGARGPGVEPMRHDGPMPHDRPMRDDGDRGRGSGDGERGAIDQAGVDRGDGDDGRSGTGGPRRTGVGPDRRG